jgi:exopolysaccharide production protein ExoZ
MQRQILSVQMLRALAALTVVIGHVQAQAQMNAAKFGGSFTPTHLLPWGAGVDLFFVISGFIMVVSSEKLFTAPHGSLTFIGRRLARIIPLYWTFSTLYLLTKIPFGANGAKSFPAWPDILASYAFWPVDMFADGHPRPFYTLGWTLNYEMFFYVLFALFIVFPRGKAVGLVAAVLTAGVALTLLVAPGFVPIAFWFQPIVLEFALGMGIALLYRRGVTLGGPARFCLFLGACLALALDTMDAAHQSVDWITPNDLRRALGWGLPAAALLAAAVLKPQKPHSTGRLASSAVLLGDASYALYLVHPFVIVGLNKVWIGTGLYDRLGSWPYIALVLISASVAALAVHRWFEMPVARRLRFKRAAPDVLAPPLLPAGADRRS